MTPTMFLTRWSNPSESRFMIVVPSGNSDRNSTTSRAQVIGKSRDPTTTMFTGYGVGT